MPASGYVNTTTALIIGLGAGSLSNFVANWRAGRTRIDDSLDVFAYHGVSGIWGSITTGLFATMVNNVKSLFYGNSGQLAAQVAAVLVVVAFAFLGSYLLLKLINVLSPLRVSPEEEDKGLDISQHGEEPYHSEQGAGESIKTIAATSFLFHSLMRAYFFISLYPAIALSDAS